MRVELPDGKIVEFPDGTPESVINSALQKQFGQLDKPKVRTMRPFPTEGLGAGFLQGVSNALIGTADLLPGVNIKKPTYKAKDLSTKIGQIAGELAPFFIAPELPIGSYGNAAVQGSIATAALGSSNNRLRNALVGAIAGPAAQSLGEAIPAIANIPIKYFGNKARNALSQGRRFLNLRTPEEVAKISANFPPNERIRASDVFLENKINPVIKVAQDKSSGLIDKILGDTDDSNIYKTLKYAVKRNKKASYEKYQDIFNNLKDRASTIAKDQEISKPVKLTNYESALTDVEKDNPDIIDLISDKLKSLSTKFKNAKNKDQSFDMAHRIQSALGDAARSNPDESSAFSKLQDAVLEDIGDAHKNIDPDLYNDYLNARKGYKQEYVPYKKKSLSNIVNDTVNDEKIGNQLLDSSNQKVLNDLTPNEKRLLIGHKLINHVKNKSSGIDVNPVAFLKAYKGIKPNIKSLISDPELESEFSDLEQILRAYNPKTTDAFGLPTKHGFIKDSSSNVLNSLLSSPALRNAYANQSINMPRNALLNNLGMSTRLLPPVIYGEKE